MILGDGFSQKYFILRDHHLPISHTINQSFDIIQDGIYLLDSISVSDQNVRQKSYQFFLKEARKVDSINYLKCSAFIKLNGYFSFTKDVFRNANERDRILTSYYVSQLHFSDRFGIDLLKIIENLIERNICNQNDLMDYYITYLWRKTEFKRLKFCGFIPTHYILSPNLESGKYSKYYKYALVKYVEYCRSIDDSFTFFYVNVVKCANNNFNFNEFSISLPFNFTPKKMLNPLMRTISPILAVIFKDSNALDIPDGKYSIIFCTHPHVIGNPLYSYD